MKEEEEEDIELDIEAKYVNKTEKEFLSNITYAECIYILTPENKYCDKIRELSVLKLCEIIDRLQKENEELKEELKEENELNKIRKDTKLDELFCRRNGKKVEQAIKLRDELLKLPECKLYGIKKCKKSVVLITKEEVIPIQKVKDKIEEILNNGEYRIIFEGDAEFPDEATCIDAQKYIKLEKLQELLEGRKENGTSNERTNTL